MKNSCLLTRVVTFFLIIVTFFPKFVRSEQKDWSQVLLLVELTSFDDDWIRKRVSRMILLLLLLRES